MEGKEWGKVGEVEGRGEVEREEVDIAQSTRRHCCSIRPSWVLIRRSPSVFFQPAHRVNRNGPQQRII